MDAHVAGIIERIDALPSPSPLALSLLSVANDESSSVRDVVGIIRQDAALTAKVLSLCRRGPRGRALDVASLDRAVVLLGFGAVRSAALAVEFVGALAPGRTTAATGFDQLRFWRHALAKASIAESAAKLTRGAPGGGRPFVAGLLQDLGILALARAAPAICDRACDDVERTGRSMDDVVADALGISASALAARLATRWRLPEEIVDVMRLRGELALAAEGPHRTLVAVAELADRAVRRRHLGGAGFGPGEPQLSTALDALGIEPARFEAALEGLFDDVAARADALGLDGASSGGLASEALERATRRLDASRTVVSGAGGDVIDELDAAADPSTALAAIIRQVARLSGRSERLLVVSSPVEGERAELREFAGDGSLVASRSAGDGDAEGSLAAHRWCELRATKAMPNRTAGTLRLALRGAALAVIHRADGDVLSTPALAQAPTSLWAFALAAAIERERARRSAERATEAARSVAACRDRIARDRTIASVGEIAAGLAHEINNPLAVVSGRAQLLRREVPAAMTGGLDEIVDAAERASAIVADLLRAVRPTEPKRRITNASEIIALSLRILPCASDAVRVTVRIGNAQSVPPTCIADPAQAADALAEVVQNALAAAPSARVEIAAEREPRGDRCVISVRDTGPGFSERGLAHGLDPFFSERPSGRGEGLGLARAGALVRASGGSIVLANAVDGGAVVRIALPVGTVEIDSHAGAGSSGSERRLGEAA